MDCRLSPLFSGSLALVLAAALAGCAADEFTVAPAAADAAPETGDAGVADAVLDAGMPDTGTTDDADAAVDAAEAAPPGANHVVWVTSHGFEPVGVSIKKGDSVTWKWYDGPHTVTSGFMCSQDYFFDSGKKDVPDTFTVVFTIATVFPYFSTEACDTFTGAVAVEP